MEVLHFNEITYKTPTFSAFFCRKEFHMIEKESSEDLKHWLQRIQTAIAGCDFGDFTDFMLIEKFLCGLSEENFEKYSKTPILDVNNLLTIGTSNTFTLNNSDDAIKFEPTKDIDELLSLQIVGTNDLNGDESDLDIVDSIQPKDEVFSDGQITEEYSDINEEQLTKEEYEIDFVQSEENNHNDFTSAPHESAPKESLPTYIKGFRIDDQNRIVCLDCEKVFILKASYNIHKRIHTGKNLHRCEICSKIFTTRSKRLRHMPTHDNDGRTFECYLCLFRFDHFYSLRIHFKMKHLISKRDEIHCSICNKVSFSQTALNRHMKIHQGLVQTHKCPHCDKVFDRRGKLTEHIRVHSDFKQFVCETCGSAFKTRKMLKLHGRRHGTVKPLKFKCAECGLQLASSFTYKSHLRQHSGERPFVCEICQKTFVQRANLLRHINVHRNEKPHSCTMCEKRFATSYHLKVHRSVHTGEKPYKCQQCDRAFTQPGTLKMHVQKKHLN